MIALGNLHSDDVAAEVASEHSSHVESSDGVARRTSNLSSASVAAEHGCKLIAKRIDMSGI